MTIRQEFRRLLGGCGPDQVKVDEPGDACRARHCSSKEILGDPLQREISEVEALEALLASVEDCAVGVLSALGSLQLATRPLQERLQAMARGGAPLAEELAQALLACSGQLLAGAPHLEATRGHAAEARGRLAAAEAIAARREAYCEKGRCDALYAELRLPEARFTLEEKQARMRERHLAGRSFEQQTEEAAGRIEGVLSQRRATTALVLSDLCCAFGAMFEGSIGGGPAETAAGLPRRRAQPKPKPSRRAAAVSTGPPSTRALGSGVPDLLSAWARLVPPLQSVLARARGRGAGHAEGAPSGADAPEAVRPWLAEARLLEETEPAASYYCRVHAVAVLAREKTAGRSTAASEELLLQELERAEAQRARHGDVARWPGTMQAFADGLFEAAIARDRGGADADPLGAAEALARAALHLEALSQLPEGSPLAPRHHERLAYARERAEHLRGCAAAAARPSPCGWGASAPPAPAEAPRPAPALGRRPAPRPPTPPTPRGLGSLGPATRWTCGAAAGWSGCLAKFSRSSIRTAFSRATRYLRAR
ncbi:unnamed protein product [Prorocentrum cordatum]|uniref:Vta1/callose synthase N-terminal domain-containing protein n=1 Tax=Prorocentrum cordatum TaxID=2364126 RepID=A0ABN9T7Y8_9DINO|nr:unnamed protein product [Polarella glacialis]